MTCIKSLDIIRGKTVRLQYLKKIEKCKSQLKYGKDGKQHKEIAHKMPLNINQVN